MDTKKNTQYLVTEEMAKTWSDANHIPHAFICPPTYSKASMLDAGIRRYVFKDYDYHPLFESLVPLLSHTHYTILMTKMHLSTILIKNTPEEDYPQAAYFAIGPFIVQNFGYNELSRGFRHQGIPGEMAEDLFDLAGAFPRIKDVKTLMASISEQLYKPENESEEIEFSTLFPDEEDVSKYNLNRESDFASSSTVSRYTAEKGMMDMVGAGNGKEAILWYHKVESYRVPIDLHDPLVFAKHHAYAINTMLRLACYNAQVHPQHIERISRTVFSQIGQFSSEEELTTFMEKAVASYAALAKEYNRGHYPEAVHKSLDYIDFHFREPLSLSILSEQCNISPGHLATLFKASLGVSSSEYINKKRITHARFLLTNSHLNIEEIAAICGFEDANYFARVFRKTEGVSPRAFRRRLIEER